MQFYLNVERQIIRMHEFPTMGVSYPEGGKIDFQEAGNGAGGDKRSLVL